MIVRLKGVKTVHAKGRAYHYHRKTMTPLPGEPGSAPFMAKLRALESGLRSSSSPGTVGSLIALYRASPEFAGLAVSTRQKYQKVFDDLQGIDAMPLAQITQTWLYNLRDRKAAQRKRAFTNQLLSVLRLVFSWGMRRGKCKANPALAVEPVKRPRNAPVVNRPWRQEELAAVLDAAPAWLRVPIALAAYTGLREADVLRVTWACYDGKAFETRAQKTGAPIWVPVHYRLRAILDAAPRSSPVIVLGAYGRPISRSRLTTAFFELLRELRAEGKVGDGLSFHGLRHTLGTALAEMGCDPPTIAAVLGQATTRMAEHYSRTANRRSLTGAAIEKLERRDRLENFSTEAENLPPKLLNLLDK